MVANSDIQIWQDAVKGINESGKTDLTQEEWSALAVLNGSLSSGDFSSDESRRSYQLLKDNLNKHGNNPALHKHLYDFVALCYKYATAQQTSTTQVISESLLAQSENKQSETVKNILFGADGQFKQTLSKNLKLAAIYLLVAAALAGIIYALSVTAQTNMPAYTTALVVGALLGIVILRNNQNGALREKLAFFGAAVAGIWLYSIRGEQISGGYTFAWAFVCVGLVLALIGKNKPKPLIWLAEVMPAVLCFLAFERLGGAISGFGAKEWLWGNFVSVRYAEAFKIFLWFLLFQSFAHNTVVAQYRESARSRWSWSFYALPVAAVLLLFCVFLNPFQLSAFDTFNSKLTAFSQPARAAADVFDTDGRKIGSAEITPRTSPLLSKHIPGYLATAYEFSYDGDFDKANITFEFDAGLGTIGSNFHPRIYYFNEDDGMLEILPNQKVISDYKGWSSVTATTEHFSTYILVDSVQFSRVWHNEHTTPDDPLRSPAIVDNCGCGTATNAGTNTATNFDVVFVIDESGSMRENDPNNLRVEAAKQFIDLLAKDSPSNRVAIFGFENRARNILGLTMLNDKETVKTSLNSIRSDGGTNIYSGFEAALAEIENRNNPAYSPVIVLMTDGQDNSQITNYTNLIARANNKGVTAFAIGLGQVDASLLRQITDQTGGGLYYYASNADVLPVIFSRVNAAAVDYVKDSNGDGISDYYAQLLNDGTLRLSNGSGQFKGIDWVNCPADLDGDGLLNGEELIIKEKVINGVTQVYVYMKSDPTDKNSKDNEFNLPDENKYHKKIAEKAAIYSMLAYDESRIEGPRAVPLSSNHLYYLDNYSSVANTLFDTNSATMIYSGKRDDGVNHSKKPLVLQKQLDLDTYTSIVSYNYGDPIGNNISFTLAIRTLSNKDILVAVILRGTDGMEWYGNMEIDWSKGTSNTARHSSFEYANQDVQKKILSYIDSIGCSCKRVNFFITGHSRGAAVGNLLAADITSGKLQNNIDVGKVFAYTFATPNNTTVIEKEYKNIFNFWFRDDFVPQVPLESWGYKKYGKSFDTIAEYSYNGDAGSFRPMMNAYALLSKGHKEPKFNKTAVDSVMKTFNELCRDVESYYKENEYVIFEKNLFNASIKITKPMSVFNFMHHYVATAAQTGFWSLEAIFLGTNKVYIGIPEKFSPLCDFFVGQQDAINYAHQAFTYWIALKCNKFNMDGYEDGGGDL